MVGWGQPPFEGMANGKRRFRILNPEAGLRTAMRNDWKRPMDTCTVYETGLVYPCYRSSGDSGSCSERGYLSYAEIGRTSTLKPSATWMVLKHFGPS